jgi:hypothetical protein
MIPGQSGRHRGLMASVVSLCMADVSSKKFCGGKCLGADYRFSYLSKQVERSNLEKFRVASMQGEKTIRRAAPNAGRAMPPHARSRADSGAVVATGTLTSSRVVDLDRSATSRACRADCSSRDGNALAGVEHRENLVKPARRNSGNRADRGAHAARPSRMHRYMLPRCLLVAAQANEGRRAEGRVHDASLADCG